MLEGITAAVLPTSSGVRGSGGARGPAFLTSSRVVLMLAFCGGTREPNRAGEEPEGDPARLSVRGEPQDVNVMAPFHR